MFVGDPYEHARDELADLVMYVEKLEDRREASASVAAMCALLLLDARRILGGLEDPPEEATEWMGLTSALESLHGAEWSTISQWLDGGEASRRAGGDDMEGQMRQSDVIIVGGGPAGMFCADVLLDGGASVTMLEQGRMMEHRFCPETRSCACARCHVIEGEGGAGDSATASCPSTWRGARRGRRWFPDSASAHLERVDERVMRFGGEGVYHEGGSPRALGRGLSLESYRLRHVGTDGIRRLASGMMDDLRRRGLDLRVGAEALSVIPTDPACAGAGVGWTRPWRGARGPWCWPPASRGCPGCAPRWARWACLCSPPLRASV